MANERTKKGNYSVASGHNQSSLHSVAGVILLHARRDIHLFGDYGLDKAFLDRFELKLKELQALPVSGKINADRIQITIDKNDKIKELKAYYKDIRMQAQRYF